MLPCGMNNEGGGKALGYRDEGGGVGIVVPSYKEPHARVDRRHLSSIV
jgi:hypothetical protein